jgi:hypothetical protein
MESYWDLYVAYIGKCVRDNWANDIDPHHYQMEWNHWLPKACFPDIKVGQWLTLRQHSIASALQTLALKKNCMCGWHKSHLPPKLLELAWPYFCQAAANAALTLHAEKNDKGKSKHSLAIAETHRQNKTSIFSFSSEELSEFGKRGGARSVELSAGIHGLSRDQRVEIGRKSGAIIADQKIGICGRTSEQKSRDGEKGGKIAGKKAFEDKTGLFSPDYLDSNERIENCRKGGAKGGKIVGRANVDNNTGFLNPDYVNSPLYHKNKSNAAQIANKQRYVDPDHLELGARSAPTLVRMQKSRGYPCSKENRVKIS